MTDSSFIAESDLVKQIGVARSILRKMRQSDLVLDEDWRMNGVVIEYSNLGVMKVRTHFQLQKCKDEAVLEVEAAMKPKVEVKMKVLRLWRNKRRLQASDGQHDYSVLVRDNSNFQPGMEFMARIVNESYAEFTGRNGGGGRCPRWRGKW